MANLKKQYETVVVPALKERFGFKHVLQTPRITKVTVNSGLNSKRDPKFMEVILETLTRISGQKPVQTKARKSEAGFKIREGQAVGAMVTLRGYRMWDFVEKLVCVTLPRIRDFRGIPEGAVDSHGNFNYGFKEHTAFPEINANEVESLHGLQVVITTSAKTHEEGLALFKALGFPFKKNTK
ncbi:50S ribosomal protein L5 [Patescibacteria group bacterium]|nr:50S ribosomal protein L5 [Patescibacteria group bacterium]MBU4453055.1 50S ribosomal protein L5 [Patescibacteria group bacterium]MCG2687554.1 50S ribosomal protein L5 [Candidatus Parcubacteria bacterium]